MPIESHGRSTPTSPNVSSHPLNLTMSLRLEAAQVLLEGLRVGLKEGDNKENDAVALLHYALNVLGLIPEQMVDEGNFGYVSFRVFSSPFSSSFLLPRHPTSACLT